MPAPPEPAEAGEIRYVPVTDSTDAGAGAEEFASRPAALLLPEQATSASVVEPAALPSSLEPFGPVLAAGPTPDLRSTDDIPPLVDAGGETVEAGLAAALDRMAAEHVPGPTPTDIGIDLFGLTPLPKAVSEDTAGPAIDFDLAAETALGFTAADEAAAPPAQPEDQAKGEGPALDLGAFEKPAAPPEVRADYDFDLQALDAPPAPAAEAAPGPAASEEASEAPGEERPFVRGRSGERRRTPFRPIRSMPPLPTPSTAVEAEDEVPRALDPARPTPPAKPAPDFEFLTRQAASRPLVVPVIVGVAAGLVLGLAGGYWLGSRNVAPAAVTAAKSAIPSQPAPAQVAPPAARPEAPSATAKTEGAAAITPGAPSVQLPAAVPKPSAPAPAAAPPPAVGESAPKTSTAAAVTTGTIRVTSTQQTYVLLDGKRVGLTPRNLKDVPLGSHTIKVTRSGYPAQEQTVVLTAKAPAATLNFTIARASAAAAPAAPAAPAASQAPAAKSVLTVFIESTPPGALIRIDGRDLAETPLTVRQMRPGTHKIELRLAGYRTWSTSITVAAGDTRRISATLERDNSR